MRTGVQEASLELRHGLRLLSPQTILGILALLLLAGPWTRQMFLQQGWQSEYVLLLAMTGSFALTPLMIWVGHRWGLIDVPTERKIHSEATPRIGGIAVYLGFMCALWLATDLRGTGLNTILIASSLLLAIGFLDDLIELPAWSRLTAQVAAAGLVVWSGTILTLFPPGPVGDIVNVVFTVFWIVGITNAFNFFDGMDGLATGLAILIALFLGVVASQTNQAALGFLALAVVGASLGFLPYNLRIKGPAHIFLGDGGSTFLGFTLACLAVKGEWADNNPVVSFKVRSIKGWIEHVGKDHLHHRFERALGSRLASVSMIFALTICLGLAAMVLRKAGTAEAILLLTQACLIVIMVTILEHAGRR